MAAPTEYYIRYRFAAQSNTACAGGATGQKTALARERFDVSGNTNVTIGKVTRIVYRHSHSSTYPAEWRLSGRLILPGRTLESDIQAVGINRTVPVFVNTFTADLPTPEELAGWVRVETWSAGCDNAAAALYWRATASEPMDLTVYFYDIRDLADGAEPPVLNGVTLSDAAPGDPLGRFGAYVQGQSSPVITGRYALDANFPYITATHALRLRSQTGAEIYHAVQADDGVFEIGRLDVAGAVTWIYTVLDIAGNEVSCTGSFQVLPWRTPRITGLTAERYAAAVDDEGNPAYVPADDGDHVRFTLNTSVVSLAGDNGWTLALTRTSRTGQAVTVAVASAADGCDRAWTEDRTLLTEAIDTAEPWTFSFTLTDAFDAAVMTVGVDEAGAFFDVEEDGVAVGMRATGTTADRRFEVAAGYTAHFYGGISGVTDYALGETPTGGHWIDGSPLYRRTFAFPAGSASGASIDLSALGLDVVRVADFTANYRNAAGADCWGGVYWSSATDRLQAAIENAALTLRFGTGVTLLRGAWATLEYTRQAGA